MAQRRPLPSFATPRSMAWRGGWWLTTRRGACRRVMNSISCAQTPRRPWVRRRHANTFENGWKPSTVPSMDNQQLEQLAVVIAILAGATVLGLIAGRLIRAPRQSKVVEGQLTHRNSPVATPPPAPFGP